MIYSYYKWNLTRGLFMDIERGTSPYNEEGDRIGYSEFRIHFLSSSNFSNIDVEDDLLKLKTQKYDEQERLKEPQKVL